MGRIAERSLPLDPSMSAPWSTPPRESGAQQGITSDSFDSRFCQSVADPKPPKLWVIESVTGGVRCLARRDGNGHSEIGARGGCTRAFFTRDGTHVSVTTADGNIVAYDITWTVAINRNLKRRLCSERFPRIAKADACTGA